MRDVSLLLFTALRIRFDDFRMKVCGVICELNPFTSGHEYLFKNARSITGADYIIAVLSGDFVQRGMPAVVDKYARCTAALNGGADLVIELPAIYATASADYFAYGGVTLLDSLGCVDFLVFGSESGDIDLLKSCAGLDVKEKDEVHIMSQGHNTSEVVAHKINKLLREGMSYPKAYAAVTGNEVASNDMLGIRYIKSIDMRMSGMTPVAIKRRGSAYLDDGPSSQSASAVRKRILNKEDYAHLVPKYSLRGLENCKGVTCPVVINDFGPQLYAVIDTLIRSGAELTDYMDVSQNIEGHIRTKFNDFKSYEDFAQLIHTKEYTKSRILRALLHIMLDIRKEDYPEALADCEAHYARILGFRQSSKELLSRIKESSLIPVISKAGDAGKILDDEAMDIFEKDVHAAGMYDKACVFKFGKKPSHDFAEQIVIL